MDFIGIYLSKLVNINASTIKKRTNEGQYC